MPLQLRLSKSHIWRASNVSVDLKGRSSRNYPGKSPPRVSRTIRCQAICMGPRKRTSHTSFRK